jgi:hypothetical protein
MGFFKDLMQKGNAGSLRSFSYSPGYCDMAGACHHDEIRKDEESSWTFESSNREVHSDPMKITVYAVSDEAAAEFEKFIKEKDVISLSKRPASDEFATDYSPWGYNVVFDCSASGGSSYESYSISEYKKYSENDMSLLKEVRERFYALKGDIISENIEKD